MHRSCGVHQMKASIVLVVLGAAACGGGGGGGGGEAVDPRCVTLCMITAPALEGAYDLQRSQRRAVPAGLRGPHLGGSDHVRFLRARRRVLPTGVRRRGVGHHLLRRPVHGDRAARIVHFRAAGRDGA